MADDLIIQDPEVVLAETRLAEGYVMFLSHLKSSFPSADQVATPEAVLAASLAELSRVPKEEQAAVEAGIRELSNGGQNMVFVGGAGLRDNLIFNLLGAHPRQRGNQINLFVISADSYRIFVQVLAQTPAGDSREPPEIQAAAEKTVDATSAIIESPTNQ